MYEPPANPSLWQALLCDEDGLITTAAEALDEFGPESRVEVSIRRLSALPVPQTPGADDEVWRLPGTAKTDDVAVRWTLEMVDDIGEIDHIETQLNMARAMAAGLNGAIANAGDWNRGTDLAAAFHDLGDKIGTYTGPLPPNGPLVLFDIFGSTATLSETAVAAVDALSTALLGKPGVTHRGAGGLWEHGTESRGAMRLNIYTHVPPPAGESPAALKARIAELEAQLAGGAA